MWYLEESHGTQIFKFSWALVSLPGPTSIYRVKNLQDWSSDTCILTSSLNGFDAFEV